MMVVGLTGGIGSGKTTVAKFFKKLGVPVYDSDKWAKRLMNTSKKIRNEIIDVFGEESYSGKKLNKMYISELVFNDKKMLEKLNNIVHPAVKEHFKSWMKKQTYSYVVQESALIFENQNQDFYDKVILVVAPQDIRIQRVKKRDFVDRKKVIARLKNQLQDSEKIPLADYVIENTNLNETKEKIESLHELLLTIAGDC